MAETVRFWTFGNSGAVRIKLRKNQTLCHHSKWGTDEGWSSLGQTFSFDGETVAAEWVIDGVDCDGRLTQYSSAECPVSQLDKGDILDGVVYPAWQDREASQRDYSAEAAGY